MTELCLIAEADARARTYLEGIPTRRVFPDLAALDGLQAFDEPLPVAGRPAEDGLALLDDKGSPATVASNGPRCLRLLRPIG